jgi:protein-tyrosine phosphatase
MSLINFSWVIPGKLAGSSMPGSSSGDSKSLQDDIEQLADAGIKKIISLELPDKSLSVLCKTAGMQWEYFNIPDFGIPENADEFNSLIIRVLQSIKQGDAVCVHCKAGIGRTGMVLTCAVGKLYMLGYKKAVETVRRNRKAVETLEQETFTKQYLSEYEQ